MGQKRGSASGPPLRCVSLERGDVEAPERFPFSIPALRDFDRLDLARQGPSCATVRREGRVLLGEAPD